MNNFIKLNSSLFDRPDHFEFFKTPNFQRDLKIFEDSDFIKERDGFIMEN